MSNDKIVINLAFLSHNFYIYAWISKYFGAVVLLVEYGCRVKHMFRYVDGQGHTGGSNDKMVIN